MTQETAQNGAKPAGQVATIEREMSYTPLAESDPIKLTIGVVMNTLAIKTKQGVSPSVADVAKFMMLCKTRRLNPFAADAYLIGYDTKDGPKFELITSIQALRKRGEIHPEYDGSERGVIVTTKAGEMIERVGTMTLAGETLVGGWAKVYRKDQRTPSYETVKLSTYKKAFGRWVSDPEGMIIKCAEAAAMRRAFPSDVGGLYVAEEFDTVERSTIKSNVSDRLADLRKRPEPGAVQTPTETVVIESGPSASPEAPSEAEASAVDEPGPEAADQTEPPSDDACAAKESKKGVQAFNELMEMLGQAMNESELQAVRSIIGGKKSILTQSQWNQLAMADSDQLAKIREVAEAERGE